MKANFRNYRNDTRFSADYHSVRAFLIRVNDRIRANPNFCWERWVWMISRPTELEQKRGQIGLWEADGEIVGLATFEDDENRYFAVVDPKHPEVYDELVAYIKGLGEPSKPVYVNIYDSDSLFQDIARQQEFYPTPEREYLACQSLKLPLPFSLDKQYRILSMDEEWDYRKYNEVMWKGFNHEGEADQSDSEIAFRKTMLSSPDLKQDLIVAIADHEGKYLAHAGIWYEPGDDYAHIEPVATIPEARRKGLAKACIYYALNRARDKGAKFAWIGSQQQFYYRIGFNPHSTFTWWRLDR